MNVKEDTLQRKEIQMRELLSALDKGTRLSAFEAAKSLIGLNVKHCAPELCRILRRGKTADNRAAAAYVLGFLAVEEATACLLTALRGSDSVKVRSHAAEALGHSRNKRAVNGLIESLTDRAATVRYWAAFALGEIGSASALVHLRKLAQEDRGTLRNGEEVRNEARRAIERIKG